MPLDNTRRRRSFVVMTMLVLVSHATASAVGGIAGSPVHLPRLPLRSMTIRCISESGDSDEEVQATRERLERLLKEDADLSPGSTPPPAAGRQALQYLQTCQRC